MAASIAKGMAEALLPLQLAATDSRYLTLLVRDLGWQVEITDAIRNQIPAINDIEGLVASATSLAEQIQTAIDAEDPDIASIVVDAIDVVQQVISLLEDLNGWSPTGATGDLVDTDLYTDLATRLPGLLITRYFEARQPFAFGLLLLAGVFDEEVIETPPGEPNLVSHLVDWNAIGGMVTDPAGTLATTYGWNEASPGWAHATFLDRLRRFLLGVGLDVRRERVRDVFVGGPAGIFSDSDPNLAEAEQLSVYFARGVITLDGARAYTEAGLAFVPSPADPNGAITGLSIANLNYGAVEVDVEISSGWRLLITGELETTGAVTLTLQPGESPTLASLPADGAVSIALRSPDLPPGQSRRVLFGSPIGTRVEAAGFEVGVGFARADGQDEFIVEAATKPAGSDAGLALVVEAGEGDSFVGEILGDSRLEVGFDGGMRWSSVDGLTLAGAPSFEVEIPIGRALGPLMFHAIEIGVGPSDHPDASVELAVGVAAGAELGPFALVVDGVGIVTRLVSAGSDTAIARFGDLAIALDFKPPNGIGIAVDVGGAGGGGYLFVDHDTGEYAGIVDLSFLSFGLTAIGILNTRLPDGSEGWSLFLSISATFSPIPLGFGFTLNGVGGLVGVNRRLDDEALLDGMRDGVLDGLMFPDDPIADAPLIIQQMNEIFPIAPGSFVFGPMVQIGWGVPTILTVEAGVVLSVPEIIIAIVGQASMVMPDEELALLDLNLDFAGIINVNEGSLTFLAELRNSSVYAGFARLALDGSIGFQIVVLNEPRFLFSIGGWHDEYDPPAGFPWAKGDLRRMSATLELTSGDDVTMAISAFFAVTPNTVQFGVDFTITAKAMGFDVGGGAGFSTLIRFSPFMIRADAYVFAEVSKGSFTLAGVWIDLIVEGPGPWQGDGTATFKFLGNDIDFQVSASLGRASGDPPPDEIDVVAALVDAVEKPEAWQGGARSTSVDTVTLRDVPPESGVVEVAPDARIDLVQTVVPLETQITKVGTEVPEIDDSYVITGARIGGELVDPDDVDTIEDWFATADFVRSERSERLSTKGYERFAAGVSFGADDIGRGNRRDVELGHEQLIVDPDLHGDAVPFGVVNVERDTLFHSLRFSATGRAFDLGTRLHTMTRETRRASRPYQGVEVVPTRFIAIDVDSGDRLEFADGVDAGPLTTLRSQAIIADASAAIAVIPVAEWELIGG